MMQSALRTPLHACTCVSKAEGLVLCGAAKCVIQAGPRGSGWAVWCSKCGSGWAVHTYLACLTAQYVFWHAGTLTGPQSACSIEHATLTFFRQAVSMRDCMQAHRPVLQTTALLRADCYHYPFAVC